MLVCEALASMRVQAGYWGGERFEGPLLGGGEGPGQGLVQVVVRVDEARQRSAGEVEHDVGGRWQLLVGPICRMKPSTA